MEAPRWPSDWFFVILLLIVGVIGWAVISGMCWVLSWLWFHLSWV